MSIEVDPEYPDVYEFEGNNYLTLITQGAASTYILPFAQRYCAGNGLDIGGGKWPFPGARVIDTAVGDGYDANKLPDGEYDYIFSSHALEHVPDYVGALMHWKSRLKPHDGRLFLYLPHPDMVYWRPEHNRKHRHVFYPSDIERCLKTIGFRYVFVTPGHDLYWSFAALAFT